MTKQYIKKAKFGTYYYKDKEETILHREDGPAAEYYQGAKTWALNGKKHRLDGPAIESADGYKAWWVNDVFIFGVDRDNRLVNRM
jgi:hypothetical protein